MVLVNTIPKSKAFNAKIGILGRIHGVEREGEKPLKCQKEGPNVRSHGDFWDGASQHDQPLSILYPSVRDCHVLREEPLDILHTLSNSVNATEISAFALPTFSSDLKRPTILVRSRNEDGGV